MDFLSIVLDRGINFLKYPVAIVMALLTFELFTVLVEIVEHIYIENHFYQYLLIGMGSYIVLWFVVFKRVVGRWFLTIEHELTHTLFALLTFHKMLIFTASNRGGYMQYHAKGGGNWLITIAPYFFPTFSMIVILFISLAQAQYYDILVAILGYSLIYHIHSTYVETSLKQTDIQEVGLPFTILFLPSANMFALIVVLSAIPYDEIDFFFIMEQLYHYEISLWLDYFHLLPL